MGYIRKALEKDNLEHPRFACCTDNMFEISVRFGWYLCSHMDHQQRPLLIRDEKVKWLDFGSTPDPVNLQPHPGYAWLQSGFSETIPWCKVQLTKQ